ncbi:MAG: hypothetical protein SOY26_02170 [Paludibacteraceae bacterium]|nr:hypothetical protein [Paludibacteraceae bacterium]
MNEQKPLLFVGGDLSGIQKFLYNITSKKAAISLKGRSAYLVNYTKELCEDILSLPSVATGNRKETVYCSGGKFYLITDDTQDIRSALDEFYHQAEKKLWEEHRGQLGIAIAYVPFYFTDNTESEVVIDEEKGNIGNLWKNINNKFTTLKNQKFHSVLQDQYDTMFEVLPVGGDVKVCAITGIESAQCVKLDKDSDGDAIWVLPSVKEQVDLGKALREKEHFKTFEEYAKGSYLGILRMDVDGMGERIQRGFNNLAEYRRFSQKLQSFFEGANSTLRSLQQKPEFRDYLNIIYAGGDDLFIVGKWSKVLDYADEIRKAFATHTTGEGLTISGGLVVVGAKFPIAKAAEMAGDAEDEAKKYIYNGKPKNAICFLGECVSWNQEFDEVKQLKDEFVQHLSAPINPLPSSLLQQVLKYADMARQGNMQYLWHAVYHIARLKGRQNGNHDAFLDKLCITIIPSLRQKHTIVALATRWAELELRNK